MDKKYINLYDYIYLRRLNNAFSHCAENSNL